VAEADLHLVRDVLDTAVVDRNGRELGRADGVILELRRNAPPRLARIEIGPAVLFARVHPALGRLAAGLEHAFGLAAGRPLAIPFDRILDIGSHIKVDAAAGETVAGEIESRLRSALRRIPGGS
jgi:hypothetical protein